MGCGSSTQAVVVEPVQRNNQFINIIGAGKHEQDTSNESQDLKLTAPSSEKMDVVTGIKGDGW